MPVNGFAQEGISGKPMGFDSCIREIVPKCEILQVCLIVGYPLPWANHYKVVKKSQVSMSKTKKKMLHKA